MSTTPTFRGSTTPTFRGAKIHIKEIQLNNLTIQDPLQIRDKIEIDILCLFLHGLLQSVFKEA